MKSVTILSTILISVLFSNWISCSELLANDIPPIPFLLENNNLGKEFWIALPQNSVEEDRLAQEGLEIIVIPIAKADIKLEVPEFGFIKTINGAEPFSQVVFSDKNNGAQFTWVVKESEKIQNLGVHITCTAPAAVFSVNNRRYTTEGFMALPVSEWGLEYYHCGYYDNEGGRSGGFIIVAGEDNTNVTVNLDGLGAAYGKTRDGRSLGESFSVKLKEGQTYAVFGDGEGLGEFDLSGTFLKGNKPFGVISFHVRTSIPSNPTSLSKDNLAEMMPPVNQWGKQFVSVQFSRQQNGRREGDGDLFRIMTSEDVNHIDGKFYMFGSLDLKGQPTVKLNKAGDIFEVMDISSISRSDNKLTSVIGPSYWSCEKPSLVNQYAFSYNWDGDLNWDPLQVIIPPIEQYISSFVFTTVSAQGNFDSNEMNLFAVGDPTDTDFLILKSVKLNDKELWKINPQFLTNRIPGTNIWWVKVPVDPGAYVVTSKTKVSGYLTGYKLYNSYGWPLGMGTNDLSSDDNTPPELSISGTCGNYDLIATENNPGDIAVKRFILIDEQSFNYDLSLENFDNDKPPLFQRTVKGTLIPVDIKLPAFAKIAVLDRAGNFTIDSVMYIPDSLSTDKEIVDFGISGVGKKVTKEITIQNIGTSDLTIESLYLKQSVVFGLVNESQGEGFNLEAGSDQIVQLFFKPDAESTPDLLKDTLVIVSDCIETEVPLSGTGVKPHISTAELNIDFDSVEVFKEVCLDKVNGNGLEIKNTGLDTLTVTAIEDVNTPFVMSNPTPSFPFKVLPDQSVYFNSICFFPQDTGLYSQTIKIISNAVENELEVTLNGIGFIRDTTTVYESDNNKIKIIPNPTEIGYFYLRLETGHSADEISVIDILGNTQIRLDKSLTAGKDVFSIKTDKLAGGFYWVVIKEKNRYFVKKLLITNN